MNLRFGLFLLLGGAAIFCHGVNISHHSEELEAMITKMMECHHLPGLAVSVVQGGSVWAKGFGEAVIGNVPFSPDTKVPIGTTANIFTTFLLDNVMDKSSRDNRGQQITWSSPVKQVLPKVGFSDPFLTEKLTLEDLAAGRTGLSPLPILWKAEALPDTLTRPDVVSNFYKISSIKEGFPFRDHFVSNSLNYGLLGRATEVIGNGTWKQLMQNKILNRLQMGDTGFLGDPQTSITAQGGFAIPYEYCPDCPSFFRTRFTMDTPLSKYRLPAIYPENGMVSTAKDMTTFLKEFLKNGKLFTRRKTNVPRSHPGVVNFEKPRYPATHTTYSHSMGWFHALYNGYDVAWNMGKLHSYLTFTAVVRDLDLAMTFFANSAGNDTFSPLLMSYIVDLAAGEPRWFNTSSVCSFYVRKPRKRLLIFPKRLTNDRFNNAEDKAGTYRDPLFGEVTVTRTGQTLNVTYGRFTGKIWKFFTSEGVYRRPDKFFFVGFSRDHKYVNLYTIVKPNEKMTFLKVANETNQK